MNGNKTYAVAALMVLHALSAYALGHDQALNLQEILGAFGLSALRAGVKKAERPESLPPGIRALLFLCALCVIPAQAAETKTVSEKVSKPVSENPTYPLTHSPTHSLLYFDSFVTALTPNFADATYGYGLGIGYQVSPYWSADIRASHSGFDTRGSVVQEVGGRLVARMPFEFLAPYTFLGATFDLERDRWLIQPGAGIEFGVNKRLRGLSLFAEGGLDADLHGRNGYVFNGGVRLRF